MEVSHKPKSPLLSPNNIRHMSTKNISPRLKIDFNNRTSINSGARRKSSEKKNHPLRMIFVHDPLNLDSLTCKSNGIESPYTRSPVHDRSCEFQPSLQPVDLRDPLSLNSLDDTAQILTPLRKRRKRKRRFSAGDPVDTINFSMTKASSENITCDLDSKKSDCFKDSSNKCFTIEPVRLNADSNDENEKISTEKRVRFENQFNTELKTPLEQCEGLSQPHDLLRERNLRFRYGNYIQSGEDDQRLNSFKKQWFYNQKCLDIGCSNGKVTLEILNRFQPSFIIGLDIDDRLIKLARSNARCNSIVPSKNERFPISITQTHGSLLNPRILQHNQSKKICFLTQNYVPSELEDLGTVKAEYDTIICLSVTMWVQLNFGDTALKRMFKKIFMQLKPGGRLLLEPQVISSYKKKKNLSMSILHHFQNIKLFPNDFVRYLLSKEIGFATSECLSYTQHRKTGSGRPLFLLTKSSASKIPKVVP